MLLQVPRRHPSLRVDERVDQPDFAEHIVLSLQPRCVLVFACVLLCKPHRSCCTRSAHMHAPPNTTHCNAHISRCTRSSTRSGSTGSTSGSSLVLVLVIVVLGDAAFNKAFWTRVPVLGIRVPVLVVVRKDKYYYL